MEREHAKCLVDRGVGDVRARTCDVAGKDSATGGERAHGQRSGDADQWKELCGSRNIGAVGEWVSEFSWESDDADADSERGGDRRGKSWIVEGFFARGDRRDEHDSRMA